MVLGGRDGEPQPLRHAARVGAHRVVDEIAHSGEVHDGLVAVLGLLGGHAHGQAAEHHVPLSGQVVEQRGVDAEQGGLPAGVDAALLGREQPGDRLQQRRLARAVPADDADGVAVVDHERDAPDRVHLANRRAALALDHPHQRGRRGALVAARAVDAVDHVQVVDDHGGLSAVSLGPASHGHTSFPPARRTRTRPRAPRSPSRCPTATAVHRHRPVAVGAVFQVGSLALAAVHGRERNSPRCTACCPARHFAATAVSRSGSG